jgi:hypothetical protein
VEEELVAVVAPDIMEVVAEQDGRVYLDHKVLFQLVVLRLREVQVARPHSLQVRLTDSREP